MTRCSSPPDQSVSGCGFSPPSDRRWLRWWWCSSQPASRSVVRRTSWASRLANPKIGWMFGWLSFWYLAIAAIALDNALASQALMPLFGMQENETTARIITVIVLLLQALLVIASTRLLGLITSGAVGVELGIVVVLVMALFAAAMATGNGHLANLTSRGITATDPNYYAIGGGLMAGMIMGLITLVGFDSAANLAEEAKDPFRSVPRAIVASVVAAALLGLAFLIALTVAIEDIPQSPTAVRPSRRSSGTSSVRLWNGCCWRASSLRCSVPGWWSWPPAPGRCSRWPAMLAFPFMG